MVFSDTTKAAAFAYAGYKCQRCGKSLTMHTARFHHKTSVRAGGSDGLANCEVLCQDCHEETQSYGAH